MLASRCPEEPRVIAAVRLGRDHGERVRAHLDTCGACREAAGVVAWLRDLAETDAAAERHELPPAATVWWKAQIARRLDEERRAAQPIERMQRAEIGLGIAGLLALTVWGWPALTGWAGRLARVGLLERGGALEGLLLPSGGSAPLFAGVLVTLLVGALLLAFVHRALADG